MHLQESRAVCAESTHTVMRIQDNTRKNCSCESLPTFSMWYLGRAERNYSIQLVERALKFPKELVDGSLSGFVAQCVLLLKCLDFCVFLRAAKHHRKKRRPAQSRMNLPSVHSCSSLHVRTPLELRSFVLLCRKCATSE